MKLTVPEVIPSIREYLEIPGNRAGGNFHLVLEDNNVSDADVRYCIEQAERNGDVKGVELGRKLLLLSRTQRSKISKSK